MQIVRAVSGYPEPHDLWQIDELEQIYFLP
jgi:hypothetical protein